MVIHELIFFTTFFSVSIEYPVAGIEYFSIERLFLETMEITSFTLLLTARIIDFPLN